MNIEMFTIEECREWLLQSEVDPDDHPTPNPWTMDTDSLRELLGSEAYECDAKQNLVLLSREELLNLVLEKMNAGLIQGADVWRQACIDADDLDDLPFFKGVHEEDVPADVDVQPPPMDRITKAGDSDEP